MPKPLRGKLLRVGLGTLAVLGAAAGAFSLVAAQQEPTVRPSTFVGDVSIGGMTRSEAAKRLRVWWETRRREPVRLTHPLLTRQPEAASATHWGLILDDQASIADAPMETLWGHLARLTTRHDVARVDLPVRFRYSEEALVRVDAFVRAHAKSAREARAPWRDGRVQHQLEIAGLTVGSVDALRDAVATAVNTLEPVELPLVSAPKRVADAELRRIQTVMGQFATTFPRSQTSRNANIRVAADKLNGIVLAPGERASFNQIVGRRTIEDGFRLAPVLLNGRKEIDIGGGICQVSSTLYNASLLAGLKIAERQCHSRPVPYIASGRDATVNWGSIDLVVENSHPFPIALGSQYESGRITFYVLGPQALPETVRIETRVLGSWSRGEKVVNDPTLPPGKTKVLDPGAPGRSVVTYRVFLRNGVEVRRERLRDSRYAGAPRLVAVNRAATTPVAEPLPVSDPELASP